MFSSFSSGTANGRIHFSFAEKKSMPSKPFRVLHALRFSFRFPKEVRLDA